MGAEVGSGKTMLMEQVDPISFSKGCPGGKEKRWPHKYNLMDESFCFPSDVPPEVSRYDSDIQKQESRASSTGKIGVLILRLELESSSKKTIVKEHYSKVPLYAQRPLYLEESLPSMAYMFIISPSGGIVQGDRYGIDITLANNALAHLTTQGATRIYKMEEGYATQVINVEVDKGSYLELVPDQIIPYQNSRFYQKLTVKVHDDATMIYSEIVSPGRVASGESFEYDICYLKVHASNQNNALRLIDAAVLQPKEQDLKTFGILGNFDVFGSVYIFTPAKNAQRIVEEINSLLGTNQAILGKAVVMPYGSGILVRMLGNVADDLKNAIYDIIAISRKTILGASFSGVRKN